MPEARTWIELSRAALRHNVTALQALAQPAQLIPIVKSNAYGHGLAAVAQMLPKRGIWGLGVAYGEEALQLRKQGYNGRIVALSAWQITDLAQLSTKSIDVVVHDFTTLKVVTDLAKQGRGVRFHLKLDTGTTRVGFLESDSKELRVCLKKLPRLATCVGIFTHYANAEEKSSSRTLTQIKRWHELRKSLGCSAKVIHSACTAAIIRYPTAHNTAVRPGLGLYGLWPSVEIQTWAKQHRPKFKLRPVLAWSTRVLAVKHVPAGTAVGYGSTYRMKRPGTIAILPVGYADGLRRALGNIGQVANHGQVFPIAGRICMNLTMLDVTTARHRIRPGDRVELIGSHITADDHAGWARTISYDILTGLSPTIPRSITS